MTQWQKLCPKNHEKRKINLIFVLKKIINENLSEPMQ